MKTYAIIFDQDRSRAMTSIMNLARMKTEEDSHYVISLPSKEQEEILSLVSDVSEKIHENGWCEDENCPRLNGKQP